MVSTSVCHTRGPGFKSHCRQNFFLFCISCLFLGLCGLYSLKVGLLSPFIRSEDTFSFLFFLSFLFLKEKWQFWGMNTAKLIVSQERNKIAVRFFAPNFAKLILQFNIYLSMKYYEFSLNLWNYLVKLLKGFDRNIS